MLVAFPCAPVTVVSAPISEHDRRTEIKYFCARIRFRNFYLIAYRNCWFATDRCMQVSNDAMWSQASRRCRAKYLASCDRVDKISGSDPRHNICTRQENRRNYGAHWTLALHGGNTTTVLAKAVIDWYALSGHQQRKRMRRDTPCKDTQDGPAHPPTVRTFTYACSDRLTTS